tara:strand:- start:1969 stop:2454 length:486 start_codon:yes stop_codon:yes gene_type:complete
MLDLKIVPYLKIIFFISIISILSAFFIERVLGYQACNLCLIERIPYGLSIILIIIYFVFKKNEIFLVLLMMIIFIFSISISLYHFGIEQGFFEESALCGIKNASKIITREELLLELQKMPVSCKDVTFRIFGFSLTSINIIINLIILILTTKIFFSYEKNK